MTYPKLVQGDLQGSRSFDRGLRFDLFEYSRKLAGIYENLFIYTFLFLNK